MSPYPLTDPRLSAVARHIGPGAVVADIGADHGHLICHLISTGRAAYGYACDIGEKPLSQAKALIARLGLEHKIEAHLTDGLTGLPLDKISHVVIAGMGGELIASLIAANPTARDSRLGFILQPMTKAERLRAALGELGYALCREDGVRAAGRLYTVMTARYTGKTSPPDPFFCWTGLLPQSPAPESAALLAQTAARLDRAGKGMLRAKHREARSLLELAERIKNLPPADNKPQSEGLL